MNRFSQYFDDKMSEYQVSKVYFTLISGLSDEDKKELDEAVSSVWSKALKRELRFAGENGFMMGL